MNKREKHNILVVLVAFIAVVIVTAIAVATISIKLEDPNKDANLTTNNTNTGATKEDNSLTIATDAVKAVLTKAYDEGKITNYTVNNVAKLLPGCDKYDSAKEVQYTVEITYKKANKDVKLFENEKASATDSSLTTVTVNYVVNVDEAKVSEVYYTC